MSDPVQGASATYGELLQEATASLQAAGVPSPEWDARIIAAHLIHTGHLDIPLREPAMPGFALAFAPLIERRASREPLQHILGVAWFGPLELEIGPGVFIPRPETEVLADWAVRELQLMGPAGEDGIGKRVLDLCTGSGALAAYISSQAPHARVTAVERADAAFAYAARNLAVYGERVDLVQGDVTDPQLLPELDGQVDLLVTNPPYVPETPDLDPEVYHDPHDAVFAGDTGMDVIEAMVPNCARWLRAGGRIGIEHDDATSAQVMEVLRAHGGFTDIEVLRDLTGTARFVVATRC